MWRSQLSNCHIAPWAKDENRRFCRCRVGFAKGIDRAGAVERVRRGFRKGVCDVAAHGSRTPDLARKEKALQDTRRIQIHRTLPRLQLTCAIGRCLEYRENMRFSGGHTYQAKIEHVRSGRRENLSEANGAYQMEIESFDSRFPMRDQALTLFQPKTVRPDSGCNGGSA